MTGKERVRRAMARGEDLPDRVPVFCQLAIGHYFLNAGLEPFDIWFRSEVFAEALVRLARRYEFDGILVNLPGRDPGFEREIDRIERGEEADRIVWRTGHFTVVPHDDNPHYFQPDGSRYFPTFEEVDPARLHYVEPWDLTDITYPYTWGFEASPRPREAFFPEYHHDTLRAVLARAGGDLSVHAEVFSPFSQFLELLNYEAALLALIDDPGKTQECLRMLTHGAIDLALRQAEAGADAILISSAFAGGGLISRGTYEEVVLPHEKRLVEAIRAAHPEVFVYTHTCGAIGDRLDLILATGTQGIDTLDPPPLGTVNLAEARRLLGNAAFVKGNLDPVNTLLRGTEDDVRAAVHERLLHGMPGGGYILSSACSVAPHAPPRHLELLAATTREHGRY